MDQETLDEVEVSLKYKIKDLNQLLLALGEVSYAKVHGVIVDIHAQAGPQVDVAVRKHLEEAAVNDPKVVTDVQDTTPGPEAA